MVVVALHPRRCEKGIRLADGGILRLCSSYATHLYVSNSVEQYLCSNDAARVEELRKTLPDHVGLLEALSDELLLTDEEENPDDFVDVFEDRDTFRGTFLTGDEEPEEAEETPNEPELHRQVTQAPTKRRGRPPGSKNRTPTEKALDVRLKRALGASTGVSSNVPKRRGRPPGSKNKPKV